MDELTPQERLQPFLLDRLRDDDPTSKLESRDRRSVSMQRFRESVLRDLNWLMNARAHLPQDGYGDYPLVEKSVLNFGITDLTGTTASTISVPQIEQIVRRAIEAYEPRIMRKTLSVRCVPAKDEAGNLIALEISGQIWALPLPESLYVKTEVDLETGDCRLKEG